MSKKPKTCGECEFMQTYKVIDYCVLDTLKVKRKSLCHHKPIQFKRKKERREKMKDKISKLQKALNYITNYHIDTEERFISYAAMMDLLRIILAEENQPEPEKEPKPQEIEVGDMWDVELTVKILEVNPVCVKIEFGNGSKTYIERKKLICKRSSDG